MTDLDIMEQETGITDYATDDARWQAMLARDAAADGVFWYGVRTTGIYCRPSCPSRHALRPNVAFYACTADARAAGLRPCKRCHPDAASLAERQAAAIAAACRILESSAEPPALPDLAAAVGLSRAHFHRLFRAHTGVTPKAYAQQERACRVREQLAAGTSVTETLYEAGFNSSGRFYAAAPDMLGMTPDGYRKGAPGQQIRFGVGQCSLGAILVAATPLGVCSILLGEDPAALVADLQDRFARAELIGGDSQFEQWMAQVIGFVEAPQLGLDLPLDIRGTAFQQRVWQALREIPPGSTVSYTEIAARIASPKAVRAVAQACAANALAVAIPCHRVVRNDGALSGYRWGIARKQALIDLEKTLAERNATLAHATQATG
ncbi:bifunctional DNA-binding transcriptional regulator/O6-methylguanine-DNA methyltransferase Ada [Amantichitinum ursilacus]|uniref:Bifunctional transcriptional activator/DNA repair enzyme Ada n=1 Tax=Amantichitinum ursilacus TaxID=857265 RepID=A0A0N0GPN4_9NEIS|nr:bifunctional DNA-binding transcriptional regulator/O6-methylguanine-DNA methyltransferase Ada [Amantichitinum ursilacus]KPC53874.1 Bifunctional transcriptional activator/DNA repair enzyme Ada [Amantichitinum ursilacus]